MTYHPYGFLIANSNDINNSRQLLFLLSSKNASALGESMIGKYNLRQSITLYCTRSLIKSTWINSNDVYFAPKDK